MILEKYSFGVGDRFGRQGKAQLQALVEAAEGGRNVVPVWNKSYREHAIIGTSPGDVRIEADAAVAALSWPGSHYVDADHIGHSNVDLFMESSDFFTLDVADCIGERAGEDEIRKFVDRYSSYCGDLEMPGVEGAIRTTREELESIAAKFLFAVREAGRVYRHIESAKGAGAFVTEISMDETREPQSPSEMFFILAAVAHEGIPAQTIAPRFTGAFHKGVDYVGNTGSFASEFRDNLAVIAFAIGEFGLPENLKLSVHSGSDKFSIYGCIAEALSERDAGLHLKTAGTTWLEELIGLALAGSEGLRIAREVYAQAVERFDELCGPYAAVIDIDRTFLPEVGAVAGWSGEEYAAALRHDQSCEAYDHNFRQLLHVGYKVAAEMGERYLSALDTCEEVIADNVRENILVRHVERVFPACDSH